MNTKQPEWRLGALSPSKAEGAKHYTLGPLNFERPARKFGIEDLEKYLAKSQDFTPIYYLIDKFLKDKGSEPDTAELLAMFRQMAPALKRAGVL